MSLRYGILGLLSTWPGATGYEIKKEFDTFMNIFWHSHYSQIYVELNKLEGEGLLESQEISQIGKPDKKAYTITDKGLVALKKWIATPPEAPKFKDPFLMQSFFMDNVDVDTAIFNLKTYKVHREQRLTKMKDLVNERLQMLKERNIFTVRTLLIATVYRKGIEEEIQYIRWCEDTISLLEQFRFFWTEEKTLSNFSKIPTVPFVQIESALLDYFKTVLNDASDK